MSGSISIVLIFLLAAASAAIVAIFEYDTGGGAVIVGSGVLIVMTFLLPRLAGQLDRRFIRQLLHVALVVKIMAAIAFIYLFSEVIDTGLKDTAGYSREGEVIASLLRAGDFTVLVSHFGIGTTFMDYLTGIVFSLIGSTIFGGFAVFSMFGLIGSIFFYKAFVVAVPAGKSRMYAVLVLLFPTVLFWTSAVGKDAVVFLFGGLAAYGLVVALVQRRTYGFLVLLASLGMIFLVRPEIAVVFALAILLAILMWILRGIAAAPGRRLVVLGATSVIAVVGLTALPAALEVETISLGSAVDVLVTQTQNEFDPGGDDSNFEVTPVDSPVWIPMSFATALFRPFPGELMTAQGLVQSAEGVLLAALLLMNLKSGLRSVVAARREPYMVFTITFAIAMILILGTTANFGLLARMRVILLPAVFTMMAYRPQQRVVSGSVSREHTNRVEQTRVVATAN